jgi:geranylgeranyl pyrophosphate synthase
MEKDIANTLRAFAAEFDTHLDQYLSTTDSPSQLFEAVRYSALAPGKRIRPYLVIECCKLVGGKPDDAWPAAVAVECIHAFSLVHDDLPALDNDDLRRGRPTTHKKFGEAMAILAGDALVMLAFEFVAGKIADPIVSRVVSVMLARAAGWHGMIGGQVSDLIGENEAPSESLTRSIHDRKTARLFAVACEIGAEVGKGKPGTGTSLRCFGMHLGRVFQIADDLLDVTSNAATLGKSAGKDAMAGKQTFPACVGVEASQTGLMAELEAAIEELRMFGEAADPLREIAHYAGSRNY